MCSVSAKGPTAAFQRANFNQMEKDKKGGQERKKRGLLLRTAQLTSSAHGFKSDTGSVHVVKCATK